MKSFRSICAILLAVLLMLLPTLQASAAGKPVYISDIRMGYGENGKAALESEGYTVWQDLNANEGGNGEAVWLGYKTTSDADDAITDIALMNMKGGYSFDAYTQEIEDLNNRVSAQLASFKAAIDEFRTNYAQESVFAKQAYAAMNNFYDDETLNADGTAKGIGDIFLDETTSDETLHRIFLEGNTKAIGAIESALALACVEPDEDNVLTRIAQSEYPDALDPQRNTARTALKTAFSDFHAAALAMQALNDKINSFEGGAEDFFAQETLSDEELYQYAVQISYYTLLSETDFGNTGMSLFDFAMLDEETENENGEVLEDEYLEMLAQSMTDGQLGLVANVGLMTVLFNAVAGENAEEAEKTFAETDTTAEEAASVYYGVDRQLFEDTDGIALTSSALREKAAAEGNDFGKDAGCDKTKAIILSAAAAAAYIAGTVAVVLGAKSIIAAAALKEVGEKNTAYWLSDSIDVTSTEFTNAYTAAHATGVSVGGIIFTVVGVIAIIAAVVLTIFALLSWIEKPVIPSTKYTEIPRVIVEKPENGDGFIAYYAAGLAGAAEGETESTKRYGDLNALNTIDQWVALYYSKNQTLGAPLTTELLKSAQGTLPASEAANYSAIHMFGSTTAANLNQYNSKNGAKAIYVFLPKAADAVSQSGSVFTKGTAIVGIATFILGAGLATAVTYLVMKKKKQQPVAAAE